MRFGTMILASAILAACASGGASSETAASVAPAATGLMGKTYVATMLPTNASGNRIAGSVRLVPGSRGDRFTAEIDLRGGAYQNKHAWTVRSGQCGEAGAQDLGTTMSYRIIEMRGDGMAQVKLPVQITIPTDRVYHVAIFSDATNRNLVVSCGVLSEQK